MYLFWNLVVDGDICLSIFRNSQLEANTKEPRQADDAFYFCQEKSVPSSVWWMHRFVWEAIFPQYCNVIICYFSLYSATRWFVLWTWRFKLSKVWGEISGCPDLVSLTPYWPSYQVLDYVNGKYWVWGAWPDSQPGLELSGIRQSPEKTRYFYRMWRMLHHFSIYINIMTQMRSEKF